jgi:glutamate 5-kinase
MASKLTFTKMATRMGIRVIIFGMKEPDGIIHALEGKAGSEFIPQKAKLSSRSKWLASGSVAVGSIQIDAGAARALMNRSSLLAVGVKKVKGNFEAGEVVEIIDEHKTPIAVACVKVGSETILANQSTQNFEVAHANDIVIL